MLETRVVACTHFRSRHDATNKSLRIVNVSSQVQLTSQLLPDRDGISGEHLDADSKLLGLVDSLDHAGFSGLLDQSAQGQFSQQRCQNAEGLTWTF